MRARDAGSVFDWRATDARSDCLIESSCLASDESEHDDSKRSHLKHFAAVGWNGVELDLFD
jgi:hypothetical protein